MHIEEIGKMEKHGMGIDSYSSVLFLEPHSLVLFLLKCRYFETVSKLNLPNNLVSAGEVPEIQGFTLCCLIGYLVYFAPKYSLYFYF